MLRIVLFITFLFRGLLYVIGLLPHQNIFRKYDVKDLLSMKSVFLVSDRICEGSK